MSEPKYEPIYEHGLLVGLDVTETMTVAEFKRCYGIDPKVRQCNCGSNRICPECHPLAYGRLPAPVGNV